MAEPKIAFSRDKIADFCSLHHICKISFFDSVLREDFGPASDVDVLVEFEPEHVPGLAFFTLEAELAEILGKKVDLHTPNWLSKYFREEILQEVNVQYVRT